MQEDAEAERRLSQAKRPQASAPAPLPKRQHFGPIESDDDEDVAEVSWLPAISAACCVQCALLKLAEN